MPHFILGPVSIIHALLERCTLVKYCKEQAVSAVCSLISSLKKKDAREKQNIEQIEHYSELINAFLKAIMK